MGNAEYETLAADNYGRYISGVVFSFCSFLLLGLTTRAPRHTPGCLASALSDLKARYPHLGGIQESVIFYLGRHWEGELRLGPV